MSEPQDEHDIFGRLYSAAFLGRPVELSGPRPELPLFAPGRKALEGSILLSAFAILIPMCAAGGILCALAARRAGNRRWLAALLAAVWCGLLGVVVRIGLGAGIVP